MAAIWAGDGAQPALRRSLITQAGASLATYCLVVAICCAQQSVAPLTLYVISSAAWLSPLNPNWIWTCPHLCDKDRAQPTVSFYTPDNALGSILDIYMDYENYHVEHHVRSVRAPEQSVSCAGRLIM